MFFFYRPIDYSTIAKWDVEMTHQQQCQGQNWQSARALCLDAVPPSWDRFVLFLWDPDGPSGTFWSLCCWCRGSLGTRRICLGCCRCQSHLCMRRLFRPLFCGANHSILLVRHNVKIILRTRFQFVYTVGHKFDSRCSGNNKTMMWKLEEYESITNHNPVESTNLKAVLHFRPNISFVPFVLGKDCLPALLRIPYANTSLFSFPQSDFCHVQRNVNCFFSFFPWNIFNLLSENIPLRDPSLIHTPGQPQQVISALFSWRDNFLWYM